MVILDVSSPLELDTDYVGVVVELVERDEFRLANWIIICVDEQRGNLDVLQVLDTAYPLVNFDGVLEFLQFLNDFGIALQHGLDFFHVLEELLQLDVVVLQYLFEERVRRVVLEDLFGVAIHRPRNHPPK